MAPLTGQEEAFLGAHLASADSQGRPHVAPICFAFDGDLIYSALDRSTARWR